MVTTALLERMGYDVVAVEDGELALSRRAAGAASSFSTLKCR
ncbi:MAG: hypothetical protein U1E15_13695 [Hyphomicrobiales bacterium]